MFSPIEILDLVETMSLGGDIDSMLSSDRNEEVAKQLGYQSYSELKDLVLSTSDSGFLEFSMFLIKRICLIRQPILGSAYYEFHKISDSEFSYYSMWSESADGGSIRVPRPLNGITTARNLRISSRDLFVLESIEEVVLWSRFWKPNALVNRAVADIFLDLDA
jgi:hypothetical protein